MSTYKAFEVRKEAEKKFVGAIVEKSALELAEGSVSIEVHYSSVNYKDALSASGSKAVTREYPHVLMQQVKFSQAQIRILRWAMRLSSQDMIWA